jgi:hypothetical protein
MLIQGNPIPDEQANKPKLTEIMKFIGQGHSIVRVTRAADERVSVVGSIANQKLDDFVHFGAIAREQWASNQGRGGNCEECTQRWC